MKLDKYHYHELLHTVSIIADMCEDHLINHHAGQLYKKDVEEIQSKLMDLSSKVATDSDEMFSMVCAKCRRKTDAMFTEYKLCHRCFKENHPKEWEKLQ